MVTRRTLVNLIAFFILSLALAAYGYFDLLGNPLAHTTDVSTVFPNVDGISPNFSVVLDGVDVGSVTGVQLVPGGAKVSMSIDPGIDVPANVKARIDLANDLGQQEIDLVPSGAATKQLLQSGTVVPSAGGDIPTDVGEVVGTVSRLLKSVPVDRLNTVLAEAAIALNGRAGAIDSLISTSRQFSAEFLAYEKQFEALLANSPPVLDTLTANAPQLRSDLAETEVLAGVLASHRYNLVSLLDSGTSAAVVADDLVVAERPNLGCLLHDGADITSNLASSPVLENLNTALQTNQWFFGAIDAIAPTGPSKSLFPGDPSSNDQEWLRTRLYLPPESPPANQYSRPTSLPAVLPGAGCENEFGRGVGPATQAKAPLEVPGADFVPPTAGEAEVRGPDEKTNAARRG